MKKLQYNLLNNQLNLNDDSTDIYNISQESSSDSNIFITKDNNNTDEITKYLKENTIKSNSKLLNYWFKIMINILF